MELEGGEKMEAALAEIADKMTGSVKVGFLEGATYPDGMSVATVAFWNEFGAVKAPPRPFFRTAIASKSEEWADKLGKAAPHYGYDANKTLTAIGVIISEDVQQSINGWTTPGNAPATIAAKGFDAPLRDTMVMLRAVDYEVES